MNQLCKVCGEPAAGFHFGAFTCEGCKSFFGRTYNNLSQVHECKNGGQCVINKQNRTSCKACRLRKCLMVGMSKTGSRYGRRSNWFKIHCLLQEQAAFNGQTQLRTPITPTLQDGSLPFVAAQLRGAMARDGLRPPAPGSLQNSDHHQTHDLQASLSSHLAAQQQHQQQQHQREDSIPGLGRGGSHPSLEAHQREQLLEALRRSHGIDSRPDLGVGRGSLDLAGRGLDLAGRGGMDMMGPGALDMPVRGLDLAGRGGVDLAGLRRHLDAEALEALRHSTPEVESRLAPLTMLEWERRLREASRRSQEVVLERKDHTMLDIKSERRPSDGCCDTPVSKVNDVSEVRVVTSVKDDPIKIEDDQPPVSVAQREDTDLARREAVGERRSSGVLMTEEERLSFLKAVTSQGPLYTRDLCPVTSSVRVAPSPDLLSYTSLNNNIFPFPPYPPIWPSMLPFPPLAKFYPGLGSVPGLDGLKPNVFGPPETAVRPSIRPSKDEALTKKRFLDAVLQVQRQSVSPQGPPSTSSTPSPQPVRVSEPTSRPMTHDQPMDLTVRRKRKMDKSEIVYHPCYDLPDIDFDPLNSPEDKWFKRQIDDTDDDDEVIDDLDDERDVDEKVVEEDPDETKDEDFVDAAEETKTEVPMKLIKLDSPGETLVA